MLNSIISFVLTVVMTVISVIFPFVDLKSDDYYFKIDASQTSSVLSNPASNVNIWSIEGNPFVNVSASEEYNIFDFVNYVQLMQCTGGTAQRDWFVDPLNREILDDYNVYYNYIYAIMQALCNEFGKDEVFTYQAAYDAKIYAQMFNNGIGYSSSWGFLSNGLLNGNPTVSYYVAKNAVKFEGAQLAETEKTSNGYIYEAEVDAVSAFNSDTQMLHIMAYNFKNDVEYKQKADLKLAVNASPFISDKVKVTAYVIYDNCNYFDEWVADREVYGIGDDCFARWFFTK